ncbi:sugar ABC transporter substrate-binding protein, partial [Micromonospora marina]|uniref:sugar ABC transporter substrate-binding protein n=1 Tax=Micromonospora marina TaxID=307120 RepID=UPI003D703C26
MRKGFLTFAAVGLLATGSMAACGDNGGSSDQAGGSSDKKPKIGVILPDSKSSARWEGADRKFLEDAFKAANVDYDIQNAQGDKNAFQTIAEQMITQGVTALMIVNLDSGTGKAVLDKAKSQGVATIDYDRLTLGGSAQYYVSFDNEAVGKLQGEGLVKCLTDKKVQKPAISYLNGSPTDNNATLFKNGYDSVLKPKFDAGEYTKVADDAVPDWDNAQAATIFEQQLTKAGGKIDGVLAANDGLGNAAISVLKKNKLNGKVPVTGQDATKEGLQNILAGDQCMTVYKAIKQEADAAAELAIALAKGEKKDTGQTVKDPQGGRDVPAVLLEPKAIFKENVKDVVADGYVTKEELCTGAFAKLCTDA